MRVIVVGGGEHGRVVMEAVRAAGLVLAGFTDAEPCVESAHRLGVPRLGDDDAAIEEVRRGKARVVIGVGNVGPGPHRAEIAHRFPDGAFATVVHPDASVSPSAQLGPGTVVLARAVIASGASVGAHVIVNHGAIVEHDVVAGDFVHVGPSAVVGGGAMVGAGSYFGLGSRVRDHVRIGASVLVGMGAVVVSDVADGARLVGVPARPFHPGAH